MRVTRGNQSAKYSTTGERSDGLDAGGELWARPGVGNMTRVARAATAIAVRTRDSRIINPIFIAQFLCHDTSSMTSTMATSTVAERGGETVRRARHARGLTQDELARRA